MAHIGRVGDYTVKLFALCKLSALGGLEIIQQGTLSEAGSSVDALYGEEVPVHELNIRHAGIREQR